MSHRPLQGASDVIDTRWVITFKHEIPTVDVATSGGQQAEAPATKRVVRTRLTVRGFKDSERTYIDRFAGTSSRVSQSVLVFVSEASPQKIPRLSYKELPTTSLLALPATRRVK